MYSFKIFKEKKNETARKTFYSAYISTQNLLVLCFALIPILGDFLTPCCSDLKIPCSATTRILPKKTNGEILTLCSDVMAN